jgi:hypothetical protein
MRSKERLSIATLLLAMFVVAGCATPVKEQEHSGFLGDYSRLQKADDEAYFYTSDKLGNYSTFMFDPVALLYEQDTKNPEFTDEQMDEITRHMNTEASNALTDAGYTVVSNAAPGVGRFRIGITKVDASVGPANIIIYTKITGVGLGGIATEAELVDAITGEQITAGVRWGSGSRVLRAGLTKTGDAKILINRWVKAFIKRLDKAHGKSSE